jgi:hypothetical protein
MWSSTGMFIGRVMPTCFSDGFGNVYGEKFVPVGSRTLAARTLDHRPGQDHCLTFDQRADGEAAVCRMSPLTPK